MKSFLKLALAILIAAPVASFAQAFSGNGTAISTTLSYYVSPVTAGSGIPVVNYVDASLAGADTNSTTACIRFYRPNAAARVPSGASASGASTITGSTNGLAANDVLVVRFKSNETYQRVTVNALSGSTITLNETLSAALTTSDEVYLMTLSGKLGNKFHQPYGKITEQAGGAPIFTGKAGRPLLVEAFGAATPVLNVVAGTYLLPK